MYASQCVKATMLSEDGDAVPSLKGGPSSMLELVEAAQAQVNVRPRNATVAEVASIDLAKHRAVQRLPKDTMGNRYSWKVGLLQPYATIRTLGSDAVFYMRCIQEGFVATLLAFLVSLPTMAMNMGLLFPFDYETEYARFVTETPPMLTGTYLNSTWTHAGRWSERCPLGEGAPITWGKPGGNAELHGAPFLSWLHVATDAASLTIFLIFLSRVQRLMLQSDHVINSVAEQTHRPKKPASQRRGFGLSPSAVIVSIEERTAKAVAMITKLQV